MKKINNIKSLYHFIIAIILTWPYISCNNEINDKETITRTQESLIGKAIVFSTSLEGMKSRADNGGFSVGDVMYIFRQRAKGENEYEIEENWKSYKFTAVQDPSGNTLFSQWELNKSTGAGFRGTTQTNSDSLYWEDGKSVRFRAYAKSPYYNDYMYADYASVSGPVGTVPLLFKHMGCRIGFSPKIGNTIMEVSYCTDPADYKRKDNADSAPGNDDNDMLSDEEAANVAELVKQTFDKMCMAGGVEMYSNADNNKYIRGTTTNVANPAPQYGRLTAMASDGKSEVIAKNVTTDNTIRPNWNVNIGGSRYMICVPYEMSGTNAGASIVIPAKTRFKIRLRDLNSADSNESQYHIFSLQDIKSTDGTTIKYPDGITMKAGYNYTFTVGYKYDILDVQLNEDGIEWNLKDSKEINSSLSTVTTVVPTYTWWNIAMNTAADEAMTNADGIFSPVLNIENMSQWIEFTNIVNGNVPQPNGSDYSGCIKYKKFYPQNGTIAKKIEDTYLLSNFDFSNITVTLSSNLDFQDKKIQSIGTNIAKFKGIFNGNGNTLSNFSGTVFGHIENPSSSIKAAVMGLHLKSTQNVSLINDAIGVNIMGISVEAPSTHAITTTSTNCIVRACQHIGIGANNGSLLGTGSGNKVYGSYIAAAGNGVIADISTFGTFSGCYYDKTLSPVADALGENETSNMFLKYQVRGVISPVLKAIKDNMPSSLQTSYSFNKYYGIAPYKVLNNNKGIAAYTFTVETSYNDRYPTLKLK